MRKLRQKKQQRRPIDRKAIRNFTLYVIKLSNGKYYVGVTSYINYMRRIKQHGGLKGARVNRGLKVEEVIEIRKLGKMTWAKAEGIEDDVTNQYMDKYGRQNVRGALMIKPGRLYLRTYAQGSDRWFNQTFWLTMIIFLIILVCFLVTIEI